MKVSDRLFGLVFAIIGLGVAAYGLRLPPMPGQAYGAGLFPLSVGLCLAGAGVMMAIGGWRRRATEGLITITDWGRSPRHLINLAITLGCLLAFGLFIRPIGFAVLTFATMSVLLMRFGQPIWRALPAGLIGAAVFQYVFGTLMRVPLPPGLLFGIIY